MSRLAQIENAAKKFDEDNPDVWKLFLQFTTNRIEKGFKNYSVNAIFERIRWESDTNTLDINSKFKLNNNYRAYYARKFMKNYPSFDGFFRTRTRTSAAA